MRGRIASGIAAAAVLALGTGIASGATQGYDTQLNIA